MLVFLKSLQLNAPVHRRGAACFVLALTIAFSMVAATGFAEEQKKKVKHRNTPLDTIMQTHLRADVPEPKDFVKARRPPAESLRYQPVTGTDPDRPKPDTPAQLKELETELETARLRADKRGGIKPSAAAPAPAKPKPVTATQ